MFHITYTFHITCIIYSALQEADGGKCRCGCVWALHITDHISHIPFMLHITHHILHIAHHILHMRHVLHTTHQIYPVLQEADGGKCRCRCSWAPWVWVAGFPPCFSPLAKFSNIRHEVISCGKLSSEIAFRKVLRSNHILHLHFICGCH